MLILLQSKSKLKIHIDKVSIGYVYYNVQFCVVYSKDIETIQPSQHIIFERGMLALKVKHHYD
jgi:hypothetical protein